MITVTMLIIVAVVMSLIGLIGVFAGGWWFIVGVLTGVISLGMLAATSERVRNWFEAADDSISDEELVAKVQQRFGKDSSGATVIKVTTTGGAA